MNISIIVPIYNAEKYLEKCIRSILCQDYSDIQVVLVNDGSTDGSGDICRKFASIDKRILYLEKKNEGLVCARKDGLCNAAGDYIGWVDADDWVEPDYFSKMADMQRETGADIVCSVHSHDIGEDYKKVFGAIPSGVYKKEEVLQNLLYSGTFFEFGIQPHIWSKLFKREILWKTQLEADERITYGEDAAVTYPSILEAKEICVMEDGGYHYVQRQGTMVKTRYSDENLNCEILVQYLKQKFMETGVDRILAPQLRQFEKFILLMRQIKILDERLSSQGKILMPYGGIEKQSKVIIYGAGVLGQRIYQYLSEYHFARIVLWVDRNYKVYQEQGLEVCAPEDAAQINDYDFVLIANSVEHTANAIKKYLEKMNVRHDKIRWLAPWFIDQNFAV